jgi:hypothetical protein
MRVDNLNDAARLDTSYPSVVWNRREHLSLHQADLLAESLTETYIDAQTLR